MPATSPYSVRQSLPVWLERARDNTTTMPVHRDGALVVPSAGLYSLYDPDGVAVVDEQAASITDGVATYSIAAATLPASLALSDRWRERWTLTLDGVARVFVRDAGLVRSTLYPVVTDADLTETHTELRTWLADDSTSLQGYIDSAWRSVLLRLIEAGRWPYLVLSPWALRETHLCLSLARCFRDYASSAAGGPGKYDALATHYDEQYDKAFARLRLTYDMDEDGQIDPDEEGVAGESVLFTNVPGAWRRGLRGSS